MTIYRPATEADLGPIYAVFYQNEVLDTPQPPAMGAVPSYLLHVLQTGKLVVAEDGGQILAYAGAIMRGAISFLTDLFVQPTRQSGQLGKTLLQMALPPDGLTHFTLSSSDPRAQALYIRAGMQPQWPCFALHLEQSARAWHTFADPVVEISEAEPDDPTLAQWDAQIGGRLRPLEHSYWVREQRAVPLWLRRRGQIAGYAYIRLGAGNLWHPDTCVLGPIGVSAPEDATACVLAAVGWAAQRAAVLHMDVPGPHPCLAPLLDSGFHIRYVDTLVSTAAAPFFDARCYLPSGGDLF